MSVLNLRRIQRICGVVENVSQIDLTNGDDKRLE